MRIPCSIQLKDGEYLNLIRKDDGSWMLSSNEVSEPVQTTTDMRDLGRNQYKCIFKEEDSTALVIRFSDLHRHSDYSLMDGQSKVTEIAAKTEYSGALTDHGNMHGMLDYYKTMKAAGKKAIIGFEAYQNDLDGNQIAAHLILLAKDQVGYKNLLYLTSEAYDHFHNKPQVTWDMLERHHEGLIATTACMGGLAQTYLQKSERQKAIDVLKRFQSLFGDDFYIEIQRHHIQEEEVVMNQMQRLAGELGIKVIATVDSHYTNKEDKEAHECLLCLQTKKTLQEPHWTFPGDGYYIHTSEEMEELFGDIPEALDNTLEIADKCNVEVPIGELNMPIYPIPAPFSTPEEYFEYLCREGWKKRFGGKPQMTDPEYIKRFDYELAMIRQMGFVSYFLIVWDYINWAREHDIYVGPGRGSAAGSLVAYCIGITDLDPIKYNLLFERFLNPERVSMPDIDTDFEHTRRQEVIDYVSQKYGAENVCRIITFGTLAAKQSVKDMARVMGYPVSKGLEISKMIPGEPHMTLVKAMRQNPDLKASYGTDQDTKKIIEMAKRLEGCKRNASVHACGIVLSPKPVREYLPVLKETDDETGLKVVTSQVQGPEVEELSLLKMDFLGLKNMTVIHDVLKNIQATRNLSIDYHDIPLDDRDTYRMLRDGNTGGVFQLESPGMTNVVMQMLSDVDDLPEEEMHQCFERMIAVVALYRPGPMDFIEDYIAGMRDPSLIHYDHPMTEEILRPTYGVIVFQEQVMQLVQRLAGYSLGRADLVRKAMGKKKQAIMDAERQVFIYGNMAAYKSGKDKAYVPGCISNGIPEATAIIIWDKMAKFAQYAFNRSHAACYAYIAIITAYMRCHWMPEFYAAMCNAFHENSDKLCNYLVQASQARISILPPDINLSEDGFTSDNGKDIRFGLAGLKGVKNFGPKLVEERRANGPFTGPYDMVHRMNMRDAKPNKGTLESLTWSGALDSFGYTKTGLMDSWTAVIKASDAVKAAKESGQYSLFDNEPLEVEVKSTSEAPEDTLMEKEKDMVGFYLSKHPIDALVPFLDPADKIQKVSELPGTSQRYVKVVGIISNMKMTYTKKDGRRMFLFDLSDRFSSIRCVVFPNEAESNASNIYDGKVVVVEASLQDGDGEDRQLIVRNVISKEQIQRKATKIIVTVNNKYEQEKLLDYVRSHDGKTIVILESNGKKYPIKRKLNLNAGSIDWLKQNFSKVLCG